VKYALFPKVILLASVFIASNAAFSSGANSNKAISKGIGNILGKKKYDKNTLTPEQLEQCILLERSIERSNTELKKEREILQAEEKSVLQYKEKVLAEKKTIDLSDKDTVAGFNKSVEEYNARREKYNAAADKYRKLSDEQRKMNRGYNEQCASKGYYEEDRKAAEIKLKK